MNSSIQVTTQSHLKLELHYWLELTLVFTMISMAHRVTLGKLALMGKVGIGSKMESKYYLSTS